MKSITTGLVGFFDILGYEHLLKNNEPEHIASEVIPLLSDIDAHVEEVIRFIFSQSDLHGVLEPLDIQAAVNSLNWMMFSDTILLAVPLEEPSDKLSEVKWYVFLAACIELQRRLFEFGTPVRGVIENGRYHLERTFFAGRPVIEAYQLSKTLDIAACVFSDNARTAFFKTFPPGQDTIKAMSAFVIPYPVPLKTEEREMLVVRPYRIDRRPIDKYVKEAFSAHNKDVTSSSAKIKMLNTAEYLRHVSRLKE